MNSITLIMVEMSFISQGLLMNADISSGKNIHNIRKGNPPGEVEHVLQTHLRVHLAQPRQP